MKRLLAILVVSLLVLAGCAPSGGSSTSASPSSSPTGPVLKVGMELAYPPFETKDAAGEPTGVSVDLAKALGGLMGRPVQIENIAWDGLIPSLQSKRVDVVISSMTITPKRAEVVSFTKPYAKAYLAFLVNAKSPAKTVADLNQAGRTIAVKKGTTGEVYVRANMPNATVTALSSENAAVTEVVQGRADAFIYDQLTIFRQAEQHNGAAVMLAIPEQQPEGWGAAVRLDDTALRDQLNTALDTFRAEGGFDALTQKYLAKEKATFDAQGFRWFFE